MKKFKQTIKEALSYLKDYWNNNDWFYIKTKDDVQYWVKGRFYKNHTDNIKISVKTKNILYGNKPLLISNLKNIEKITSIDEIEIINKILYNYEH